jgi:hypothetical protein
VPILPTGWDAAAEIEARGWEEVRGDERKGEEVRGGERRYCT